MGLWQQTTTLMYRTYLLKKRIKGITFQEVIMPIYFVVLLVILKVAAYKPTFYPMTPNNYSTPLLRNPISNASTFYVAPNFPDAERLMSYIKGNVLTGSNYTMFSNQADMDTAFLLVANSSSPPIGVYFPESGVATKYALRFPFQSVPGEELYDYSPASCRNGSDFCSADNYLKSGFVALQNIIDSALIQVFYNSSYESPTIATQRYPKAEAYQNSVTFQLVSSLYLVIAFAPFMMMLLILVVFEKEKKIKEGMKMMGLSSLALWLSWSIVYIIIIFVMTMVMSLLSKFGQLFPNCDFLILFLLFFFYGLSLEAMGFMLSTFFSNPKSAGAVGFLLSIFMSLLALLPSLTTISVSAYWALSLLSPACFAIAIGQVAVLDLSTGVTFANLWSTQYPIGVALVMLPVDIVIYFLLTLYFDNVVPGEYGQHKSPIFFLKPSFWCPTNKKTTLQRQCSTGPDLSDHIEPIEQELVGKEAVQIRNITKVYSSDGILTKQSEPTVAVKNFSMDIYEGQITALLGHNGAGKTTLFNILTGFTDATSGSATVYGYDVSNAGHMTEIRRMTGVCPQHNILIDQISVEEHLNIFAGIKGLSGKEGKAEIERTIKLVGLEDQRHTFANKLSGGQKRKLSVGIAVMGDPKILILDEPTAGMDPFSRNKLWDVLRSRKEGRITLLTTHFMDEADILADRKAVISRGRLRCVGSSLFLKNKYGVGYHLGVVAKSSSNHEPITACVHSHVSGAELQRSIGFELGYTLPLAQVANFADLFRDLEENGEKLNVQSFGVSMTTLEEVFLKIGEEDEADEDASDADNGPLLPTDSSLQKPLSSAAVGFTNSGYGTNENRTESVAVRVPSNSAFNPRDFEGGERNWFSIYKAMLWRMFLVYIRNPAAVFFGFILPIGLVIGACAVMSNTVPSDSTVDPPLVDINPSAYNSTLLMKNSTGSSLDFFLSQITNKIVEMNDLTNLIDAKNQLASDMLEYTATKLNYVALYNTNGVHSLPALLNTIGSASLSTYNQSIPTITTYNKRWPAQERSISFSGGLLVGSMMAGMALLLTLTFGAINPVQERELKINTQLRVSGVTTRLYWLSSFSIDYSWYLVVAIVFIISILAFQVSAFGSGALGALVLLLIGWGGAGVLTSYCGSFMFDKYETAQNAWISLAQVITLFPYLIVSLVDQLGSSDAATYINVVFVLISPMYSGFSGIYYINKIYTEYALLGLSVVPVHVYFDWSKPMVPFSILMTYVHIALLSLLLLVLTVVKDGGKASDVFKTRSRYRAVRDSGPATPHNDRPQSNGSTAATSDVIDNDVRDEENKVARIVTHRSLDEEQPVVLVHNLHKKFVKRAKRKPCTKQKKQDITKVAVDDVSLSVVPGQVLGLLGPNGAGKTTVVSMITADTAPSGGKVHVSGHEITSNLSAAHQDMGYCSQDNSLWENITLQEHLEIYATAHGIPSNRLKSTSKSFIEALGVTEHKNKRAKSLSGGTKRKLCFAIAMMGNPQVVLLDEPSTGMDPKTKRFMWDTISSAFEGTSRGAILTTHYMEEADALCSRVAIMVLGNLKCIGSTQHLKSKFGQGYVLEVKLKHQSDEEAADQALREFVTQLFGEVSEPEKFSNRFVYKVTQDNFRSLSSVFGQFESAKEQLGIEEYSFSQATLEQVFLRFAREQDLAENEEEERARAASEEI